MNRTAVDRQVAPNVHTIAFGYLGIAVPKTSSYLQRAVTTDNQVTESINADIYILVRHCIQERICSIQHKVQRLFLAIIIIEAIPILDDSGDVVSGAHERFGSKRIRCYIAIIQRQRVRSCIVGNLSVVEYVIGVFRCNSSVIDPQRIFRIVL